MDIIEIPGYPGLYARRIVVEMWQAAGSPPINDAGRLFAQQLEARLKYENGTGSPADDPRRPDRYPLAHVRFAALDVATWARGAMIRAGFEYPYDYEPWHGQLPNIYSYPLVTSLPSTAAIAATPVRPSERNPDMPIFIKHTTTISWPNGFTNSYSQAEYDVIQWVANGENKPGEQWMVDVYVNAAWAAARRLDDILKADDPPAPVLSAGEVAAKVAELLKP